MLSVSEYANVEEFDNLLCKMCTCYMRALMLMLLSESDDVE